jgi:hypothetical protein
MWGRLATAGGLLLALAHASFAAAPRLARDLYYLTKRAPNGRDWTDSLRFHSTMRWVARRMQQAGLEPMGVGARGSERFLQPFEVAFMRPDAGSAEPELARHRSWNALGLLRGDGSTDETVLVLAHVDGLSARQKRAWGVEHYEAANDNATAVAAGLRIADTLARLERARKRPLRRNLLFAFTSAEEQGLRGSEALARFSSQLGGLRLVGAVTFEMIGRGGARGIEIAGGPADDTVAASANPVFRRALALPTKGNMAKVAPAGSVRPHQDDLWKRSDHDVFRRLGVPAVIYVGAMDDYHSGGDNFANLEIGTNQAVARHATHLLADLANRGQLGRGVYLPRGDARGYEVDESRETVVLPVEAK